MGLNALVTHSSVPQLVRNLALEGDWTARDTLEYSRVGRVSEQAMLLNIVVRAALDRCVNLQRFIWDLNAKLQGNVYSRLSTLEHLRSVQIRFPCIRAPQPTLEVPAIPRLKSLIVTQYDPLCYPDDVSNLLFHATQLEELQLHFSPRMREEGEPSVHLSHFFRKNIAAERKLKLRKFGVYNLFARAEPEELMKGFNTRYLRDFTSLNTFGRDEDHDHTQTGMGMGFLGTEFLDRTWISDMSVDFKVMRTVRMDQLHRMHVPGIMRGLERLYLVNARYGKKGPETSESADDTEDASSMGAGGSGSATTPSSALNNSERTRTPNRTPKPARLRDLYLDAITNQAGPTLKHLIFPVRWGLGIEEMARLIRSCPNLTQLSCHFDCTKYDMLNMLIPFLKGLVAIRLRAVPESRSEQGKCKNSWMLNEGLGDLDSLERRMRVELAQGYLGSLKYIGLREQIWEVGGMEEVVEKMLVDEEMGDAVMDGVYGNRGETGSPKYREEVVWRRKIKRVGLEAVRDVEIWKCDSLDVV